MFVNCKNLTNVKILNEKVEIDKTTFLNCINLETIQVPIDDIARWEEMLNTFKLNDESVRRNKKIRHFCLIL